jgi:hypothetical protein
MVVLDVLFQLLEEPGVRFDPEHVQVEAPIEMPFRAAICTDMHDTLDVREKCIFPLLLFAFLAAHSPFVV